jgi:hypothetical protein
MRAISEELGKARLRLTINPYSRDLDVSEITEIEGTPESKLWALLLDIQSKVFALRESI